MFVCTIDLYKCMKSLVKDVIIEICLSNRNFKVRHDHNKKKSLEIPKG